MMNPAFGNITGMLGQGQPAGLPQWQGAPAMGGQASGNQFNSLADFLKSPQQGPLPNLGSQSGLLSGLTGPLGGMSSGSSGGVQPADDHWQSLISTLMQRLGAGAGGGGGAGSQFLSPSNMGGKVPDMSGGLLSGGLFGNNGALSGGTLAPTFSFSGLYSR